MSVLNMLGVYMSIPPTSKIVGVSGLSLSTQRASTDPIFRSDFKLMSSQLGFSYSVSTTDLLVGSGTLNSSPEYITDVEAFTETDQIVVSYLKYGFQFGESTFIITPLETTVYMSQKVNSNTTLDSAGVSALTGITVDKALKTITVSESHSISNLYDYMQYWQSLIANIDILDGGEIFSTVLGTNFSLLSDWSLVFSTGNTGLWNITASNVTLSNPLNLTTFNLSGTLLFDASGSYNIASSNIDSVNTVDGNETVVVEPSGSTTIANNLDATNITVNAPSKILTLAGIPVGAEYRLYVDDPTEGVLGTVELVGSESHTGGDVQYATSNVTNIVLQVIHDGYLEYQVEQVIGVVSQTIDVKLVQDRFL